MKYLEAYQSLSSFVQGQVRLLKKEDSIYQKDFGNIINTQPKIIVHAASENDIAQTLRIANQFKIPVAIRGAGHSCNGQTLSNDIVLVNYNPEHIKYLQILGNGNVSVPTCVTWENLERSLNEHHLSCPVLTSLLKTSIGGTLSVGGIGVRSIKYGAQVDQVVKLKLILPNGNTVWCSEGENSDLFRFSLAGLGSLGVIETVILRTIPNQPYSVENMHTFADTIKLDEAVAEFLQAIQHKTKLDWINMMVLYPFFQSHFVASLEYGTEYEESLAQSANQKAIIKNHHFKRTELFDHIFNDQLIDCKNIWVDYFLSADVVIQFVQFLQDILLKTPQLSENLRGMCFLAVKRPNYSPSIFFHPAKEKNHLYITVGTYFVVTPGEDSEKKVLEIQRILDCLLKQCVKLSGRPYFYGMNNLKEGDASFLFKEDFERFLNLKKKYDPNGIISLDRLWGKIS